MKKIFNIVSITCLLFAGVISANAQKTEPKVQFIYINGSNSNDENAKEAYVKGYRNFYAVY